MCCAATIHLYNFFYRQYLTFPNTLDFFSGPLWLNRCQMFDTPVVLVLSHVYSKSVSLPHCCFHRAAEPFVFYGSVLRPRLTCTHSVGTNK